MGLPIKINLPEGFLDKEVRYGYEVSGKLKKIWAIELDLLHEFVRVCEKHDIKYTIFAGTMLGAVRHGGFIPWDDDLDIAMKREEYDKLCSVAKNEFVYPYFFQTALTDSRYFCSYARLRNSETTGVVQWQKSCKYNNGIYIDIFVLEGYYESKFMWMLQSALLWLVSKPLRVYYNTELTGWSLRANILRLARTFSRCASYLSWFKMYGLIHAMATKRATRIGLRTHPGSLARRYWLYKNEIDDTIKIDFEGFSVCVVKNYDVVLKRIYGDYMRFPPEDERGRWHEGVIHFEPNVPYRKYLRQGDNTKN